MSRILIIEDGIEILTSMRILLESKGFIVSCCKRDLLAITSIKEKQPDIVLFYLTSPFISGLAFCKSIRLVSDLPFIVITDKELSKDVITLYSIGVDDVICKPFYSRELVLRIKAVIKRCVRV